MSRRSEIPHKSNNVDFNLSLFEHALKDPASKNVILQLLSANNKNVFELFKPGVDAASSPVRRVKKKEHCESPTALLRRRELEKKNRPERPESAQSHTSEQSTQSSTSGRSSTIPFERILKNVVAYVEINSNGNDRSGGAKALLRSMGATVCEKFTRDVTHVIFKDGLYTTYQRAKLLKVHLVSVLWLEATRRNGVRAQEKNYPALGTKNYDLNVSMICSQMQKDYEDVIRDEIRRTLESGTPLPCSKSFMDNRRKTVGSSSKSFDRSSQLASQSIKNSEVNTIVSRIGGQSTSKKKVQPPSMTLHDSSPAVSTDEDLSILSKKIHSDILNSSTDSFRPASLRLEQNEMSDSDSECGMIDGHFSQRETVVDDTYTGIAPLQSDEIFPSNMELTCTEDSDSQSIMSNRNRTSNLTASMDLTTPNAGSILQNLKGSILNSLSYITSRNQSATGAVKRKSDEKENYSNSSVNKTPKTLKVNSDRSKSTIKRRKNVEKDTISTPRLENENTMCEDGFYSLKTPKLAVQTKKLPKPVNIMNQGYNGENELNNVKTGTSMSSLRISSDLKEKMGNSKGSNDDSSLRTSTENTKKSNGTSMSSLRLNKSSLENSNLSDVPSLRISSENQKISDIESRTDSPEKNAVRAESNPTPPLSSTPFVTERKKRQTRRSVKPDSGPPSSGTPVRNTRSSVRVSSVHKKEVEEFAEELGNKKNPHDKNKEVELVASRKDQACTPRPARKFPSKTPTKSDVFISPFVNTRRRGKSNARAVETMDCDQEDGVISGKGSTRRSSRINKEQSTSTPEKIGEETADTPEVSPEQERPSEGESEEQDRIVEAKELSNIVEEDENVEHNNSSNVQSLKPVVLLQNILMSQPEKANAVDKKRSEIKPQQDKCVVSLVSISNEGAECSPPKKIKSGKELRASRRTRSALNDERNEKDDEIIEVKTERKSRRRTTRVPPEATSVKDGEQDETSKKMDDSGVQKTQRKISRSKSESDVQNSSRTRKSRRLRRLYDPDQVDEEEEIQERLGVNDQEERKTIREEKVWKVNVKSQNSWLNGNMLMTQKAMEFLGRSQGNVTTLFKEPESVLERLGINNEKKKEKKKKESIMNNSDDEQVDLAEEFVNKKSRKTSKEDEVSLRTPRTQKSRRNLTQQALTTGNSKRRSTMEFAPKPLSMPKARIKLNLDQKPTIVCTKMHKADVQVFNQIVKKLGKFEIEDEVSSRTTHLVVGEPKRTVNMLRALARGCWILKQEWLLSSLEERAWLPEEKYEVTEFSPAVQQCRLRRQAFGPTYHMNIFLDCGAIFVAKSTIPRCSDIRELITLCEGKVTKIPDNAKIAVGAYFEGCDCVNEYWVLDSITSGKLEPIDEYAITAESAKTKSPFV